MINGAPEAYAVPELPAGQRWTSFSMVSDGDNAAVTGAATLWCGIVSTKRLKCWEAMPPEDTDGDSPEPPAVPEFFDLEMDDDTTQPTEWSAVHIVRVPPASGIGAALAAVCAIDAAKGEPYCFSGTLGMGALSDEPLPWSGQSTPPTDLAPSLQSRVSGEGASAKFVIHSAHADGVPVAWELVRAATGPLSVSLVTIDLAEMAANPQDVAFWGPKSGACGLTTAGTAVCIDEDGAELSFTAPAAQRPFTAVVTSLDGVCGAVPSAGYRICKDDLELGNATFPAVVTMPPEGHAVSAVCRPTAALPDPQDTPLLEPTAVDLSLLASLTTVRAGALESWPNARVMALGASVASLEADSFRGLARLAVLDLAATSVTAIPDNAFRGLAGLRRLALPPSLATLSVGSFAGLTGLTELDLSATDVASLPRGLFAGMTVLRTLTLPPRLVSLGAGALSSLAALTSLDLSAASLTSIGGGTFAGLSAVTSLALPTSVSVLEPSSFSGLSSLAALDLSGTGIASLPGGVLTGLDSMTRLDLPASLASLAPDAFAGAPGLAAVNLSATAVTALPAGAFRGAGPAIAEVTLPAGLSDLRPGALAGLIGTRALTVACPGLRSLPAGAFQGMAALRTLTVRVAGGMAAGCDSFRGLPALQSLDLAGSGTALSPGAGLLPGSWRTCSFGPTLQTLRMRGFNLTGAELSDVEHLAHVPSLRTLEVTDCVGAPELRDGLLTPLAQLRTLSLRSCGVGRLPQLSFGAQELLSAIDIVGNVLSSVDSAAFDNLFALATVSFESGKQCGSGTAKVPLRPTRGEAVPLCVTCSPGFICPDGFKSIPCPRNTFQPRPGQSNVSSCEQCPAGTVTTATGSMFPSDCVGITLACPVGTAGVGCRPCGPGEASPGGNVQECRPCPIGSVSAARLRSAECVPCPGGSFQDEAGAANLSSCKPCGPGLVSREGTSTCRACPAGLSASPDGTGCVALPAERCTAAGWTCLPGVPGAVPDVPAMAGLLRSLPLDGAFKAPPARAAARARLLQSSGAGEGDAVDALVARARQQFRGITAAEAQLLAWAAAGCLVVALVLLLLAPCTRLILQLCLRTIDQMSTSHSQEEFAATRIIHTPAGGFFSVAAVLTALAMSTSLVMEFAVANTARSDGLQVLATGIPGAERAAGASSDMVIDVTARPAPFVRCADALSLQVSIGSVVGLRSDAPASGLTAAARSGTVSDFAARTSITERALGDGTNVCWLRALCQNCSFDRSATLTVRAHWSSQILPWRLAMLSSEGTWVSVAGTAASPAAAGNASGLSGAAGLERLRGQSEAITVIPHLTTDSRSSPARQTTGFVVQDARLREASVGAIDDVRPSSSDVALSLRLQTSAVLATVSLTSVYTLTQLLSAIVGVVVGILGSFGGLFSSFERTVGKRLVWLCGRTGLVSSEEEAMSMASEREAAARRSSPRTKLAAGHDHATSGAMTPSSVALRLPSPAAGISSPPAGRQPSLSDDSARA